MKARRAGLGILLSGLAAVLAAAEGGDPTTELRSANPEVRDRALDSAIQGKSPDAGPALLDLLATAGGPERVKIVRALGALREPKALRPLLGLLGAPSEPLRYAVVEALGAIGDREAAERLDATLEDEDPQTRAAAARALGSCGTADSVPALGASLADPNRNVRLAAIEALGRLGFAEALAPLKTLLRDPDKGIRRQAVLALGALRSADVGPVLKTCLEQDDPYLRGFGAEALALRQPDPALVPALVDGLSDPVVAVQIRSAEALGAWRTRAAVPGLLKLLASADPTLRWKAVLALGAIGDPAAKGALERLRDQDPEAKIRAAAAGALQGRK